MNARSSGDHASSEAPCTRFHHRFTTRNAARGGQPAANTAVRRAKALGIGRGAPIYFVMEAYDCGNASCRAAVLRFLNRWTRRMRTLRYTPGVYSSAASGVRDLGRARGISKPTSIWFAHWDNRATTARSPYLSSKWWPGHRRIKQYRGPHNERHGGYLINIDSDVVNGRVY